MLKEKLLNYELITVSIKLTIASFSSNHFKIEQ